MPIKFFTPEDFYVTKQAARPTFTVTKNSLLTINKPLAEQLELKDGDLVIIGQDEKSPKDWFIGKAKDSGFAVSTKNKDMLGFSCKPFAEMLRKQFEKSKPPIRIPVSPQPSDVQGVKCFALLTKATE